jgi:DNA primase
LKEIIIWPDNDTPGFKASETLCSELRKVGVLSLKVVNKEILQKVFPEKWDLADPLPEGKSEQLIKDLLLEAPEKTVGLKNFITNFENHDSHTPVDILKANESPPYQ